MNKRRITNQNIENTKETETSEKIELSKNIENSENKETTPGVTMWITKFGKRTTTT